MTVEAACSGLRDALNDGVFPPGSRLGEVTVAERLEVSRTIARLAMAALEHEGLLVREPNRGTRVRGFAIEEVMRAIEVRGELEAMAARQAAERGLDPASEATLASAIADGSSVLQVSDRAGRTAWVDANRRFHEGVLAASGNWAIATTVRQISVLPLVSSGAILFLGPDGRRNDPQLSRALDDHGRILDALRRRAGNRAAALMREHALMSAANKRANLMDEVTRTLARSLPGGALIVMT